MGFVIVAEDGSVQIEYAVTDPSLPFTTKP